VGYTSFSCTEAHKITPNLTFTKHALKELLGLMGELQRRGVEFRSPRESLDATTPAGKLVVHVFASLAKFERDVTRERTVAGLGAARARGKKGGRKRVTDGRKVALAARLMRDRDVPISEVISEVCGAVGVSRAALYRYLNPDGTPRG
jgi:DNA invertase Pin-like site-specific DNA recombinase